MVAEIVGSIASCERDLDFLPRRCAAPDLQCLKSAPCFGSSRTSRSWSRSRSPFRERPSRRRMPRRAQENAQVAPKSGGDPFANIEEMIVTGAGDFGALIEVPTSVVSFDSDYLKATGAIDIRISRTTRRISRSIRLMPLRIRSSSFAASGCRTAIRMPRPPSPSSSTTSTSIRRPANSPACSTVERRCPAWTSGGLLRPKRLGGRRSCQLQPPRPRGQGGHQPDLRPLQPARSRQLHQRAHRGRISWRRVLRSSTSSRDPLGENRCHEDRDNNFPPSEHPPARNEVLTTAW